MTPEERKARKEQRTREEEEKEARFPLGRLISQTNNGHKISIVVCAGDRLRLLLSVVNAAGEIDVSEIIYLDNPLDLAEFIRALVARYNALIVEMNTEAANSQMLKASPIENENAS